MSMGQDAMQAPQYMHIPLFTTSVIRLPKIFNFFGNGFHPSPSTLDFNGVAGGTRADAFAGTAGGTVTVGFGVVVGGLAEVGFEVWGGADILSFPSSRQVLLHAK